MRRRLSYFLFLLSLSLCGQQFSKSKIGRMLKKIPVFEQAHIALSIEPLNSSKPKAFYQGENYMTPASNIKILTFLAAIQNFDSLPVLYFQKQDSIMKFKATGYPLLFHPFYPDPKLDSFFKQNYHWHYHAPKSELNPQGSGWSWDDYLFYYAAENSPFPIYGNTTQIIGGPNNPQILPKALENQLFKDTLINKFFRKLNQNHFYYNPQNLSETDTLYRPFITSDSLFVRLLKQHIKRPIEFTEYTNTESNWEVLYSDQETSLYKALLKESDNGIAEALLTMISQKIFGEMNIQKTIDTLKIQWDSWLPDPIEWVDGSGVSRYNMITPRTLIAVLKKIHDKVGLETIIDYFPKSTVSATLKDYQLTEVYAKTGTLKHNHNLSGYWISSKGTVFVFSIMVNHFTQPTGEIRKGITQLLKQFQKKLR